MQEAEAAAEGEVFQSTHPVGGGTRGRDQRCVWRAISIHPPRGGWDLQHRELLRVRKYFNPPTPWGVGPLPSQPPGTDPVFQSTHPVGGGTWAQPTIAKLVERFQSTHPVGGGTGRGVVQIVGVSISIHPPRGGWDPAPAHRCRRSDISIHPPRGGWDSLRPPMWPG